MAAAPGEGGGFALSDGAGAAPHQLWGGKEECVAGAARGSGRRAGRLGASATAILLLMPEADEGAPLGPASAPVPRSCKPKRHRERPRRHLYLLHCPAAELAALAARGARVHVPAPRQPKAWASFPTAAAAAAAKAALDGRSRADGSGGRVAVHYAALEGEAEGEGEAGAAATKPAPTPIFRDASEAGIPGLALFPEFVTEAEERDLLAAIDGHAWVALAKRRVQHYGYAFDYATRSVAVDGVGGERRQRPGLPGWLGFLLERLGARVEALAGQALDQATVNEYACGVGLAPHVDTHSAFSGAIVSLTLAGRSAMEFRREGRASRGVALERRSLLVMAAEARYAWAHYIPHRKADIVEGAGVVARDPRRVSVTLRTVRGRPCACGFPETCDSRVGVPPTRLSGSLAGADA